jgi:hypothetical protein
MESSFCLLKGITSIVLLWEKHPAFCQQNASKKLAFHTESLQNTLASHRSLGAVSGDDRIEILAVPQVLDRNPHELVISQLGVPWMPFSVFFGYALEPFLLIGEHPPRNFFIRYRHWPLVSRHSAVVVE